MKVIFNELALYEFKDAIEFYELQRPGLGREFGEEIKKSLKRKSEQRRVKEQRALSRSNGGAADTKAEVAVPVVLCAPAAECAPDVVSVPIGPRPAANNS